MRKTLGAARPRWRSAVGANRASFQLQDGWERSRAAIPVDVAILTIPASIRVRRGCKALQIGETMVKPMCRKDDQAVGTNDLGIHGSPLSLPVRVDPFLLHLRPDGGCTALVNNFAPPLGNTFYGVRKKQHEHTERYYRDD